MKFQILSAVAFAASVAALAAPSNHVLHEKREAEPKHWVKRSRLESHVQLPMRIGLTQSNLDRGEDLLMEISDPDSPRYGKHYTQEEIIELFAPAKQAVNETMAWLHDHGISPKRVSQSVNKQWIQFDAAVHEAEKLFKTKYYSWMHKPTGKTHPACDEYHVPEHIKHHIDYITPGLKLFAGKGGAQHGNSKRDAIKKRAQKGFPGPILGPVVDLEQGLTKKQLLQRCDNLISPPCIAAMYNITKGTKAHKGNELGIFEEGDFYAPEDLVEFFALLAPYINPLTRPILKGVDGAKAPGLVATGESDLDFQISYPIIHPQDSVLFQTDDFLYSQGILGAQNGGFLNTFLDAIDGSYCTLKAFGLKGNSKIDPKYPNPNPLGYQGKLMCGAYKPTNVISISYGAQEDDVPTSYQRRQCLEFMKLGMQGVTVVLASGDSGVAARSSDDGNANGCLGKKGTVFNPDFPASCPYVTALGATVLNGDVNKDQEVAVSSFPSGGGFSNIYPRPKYQDAKLNTYFSKHDPGYSHYSTQHTNNPPDSVTIGRRYNRAGRGYPDAAAIGDNVVIILDGVPMLIGGTSASAPVFASIINRINEERLSKGKKPVGFVNPTMYKNAHMFHDITKGSNPGCGTKGFSCTKGWDPVTGLGTPNYPEMLKVFMKLP